MSGLLRRRTLLLAGGAACWAPAHASLTASDTSVFAQWKRFKAQYLQTDGSVRDTHQKVTHTEGLGVAMLAAQACDDWSAFEAIWRFAQKLRRPDGLFSWKWEPGKGITDPNNASDGEVYLAWALLRAGLRKNNAEWIQQAQAISDALLAHCVFKVTHGTLLAPAKAYFIERTPEQGERLVVNPSYWVFPALEELAQLPSGATWQTVIKDGLNLLNYARFGAHQLPADWLLLQDPVIPWPKRPSRFGYEAIRVPLFLAWANKRHPALQAYAKFSSAEKVPAWVDVLKPEQSDYLQPVGFEAVARLAQTASSGSKFRLPKQDTDYYSSSLVLLTALAAQDRGWL